MRIRQNNTMLVKLKAWLGKDVKVKSAVCSGIAAVCAVALAVGAATYAPSVHSAAVKEAAETIEADNADYAKLIDDYDTATETIDKADGMKADIKKMEATRDNLQAQIESLTGQVDNAKRTSASDGVWQVGKDIDAGTYRANNSVTDRCYWEISVGDDIVQNDIQAPELRHFHQAVTLSSICPTFVGLFYIAAL